MKTHLTNAQVETLLASFVWETHSITEWAFEVKWCAQFRKPA